ncbi:CLUMA_CG019641, isoform A [Clunio marinus]|uniref:CLUMA_CG019641, isoform A n=1 Tax=Clunio marinus TaxID=568069 RepID=A0A1J1J367_9DIPT|nr:CLUMA_CG019641, isoform A [Clunio marinus]
MLRLQTARSTRSTRLAQGDPDRQALQSRSSFFCQNVMKLSFQLPTFRCSSHGMNSNELVTNFPPLANRTNHLHDNHNLEDLAKKKKKSSRMRDRQDPHDPDHQVIIVQSFICLGFSLSTVWLVSVDI